MAYLLFLIGNSPYSLYKKKSFDVDKSFIRFGDGEILTYLGISFEYQESNLQLAGKLDQIIKEFNKKESSYDIGLPFSHIEHIQFQTPNIRSWIIGRYMMKKIFSREYIYVDAFYFHSIPNLRVLENVYSSYDLHIVTHSDTINKLLESPLKDSIIYTTIPKINAFESLRDILKEIENTISNKLNTRILVSAGPTAKVLVYELSKKGYIAHDTGALFDKIL